MTQIKLEIDEQRESGLEEIVQKLNGEKVEFLGKISELMQGANLREMNPYDVGIILYQRLILNKTEEGKSPILNFDEFRQLYSKVLKQNPILTKHMAIIYCDRF